MSPKQFLTLLISFCSIQFISAQNVGIETSAPKASLHVDSTVLFTGSLNTSSPALLPISGEGVRMLWYADRAAFRAGYVDADQWDLSNIGNQSIAFGNSTKASGFYSFATGFRSSAIGDYSIAFGDETTANGTGSMAIGNLTNASGQFSIAFGNNNTASGIASMAMGQLNTASGLTSTALGVFAKAKGDYSSAIGRHIIANGFSSTVTGLYNDTIIGFQTAITPTTPLFIVGNGDDNDSRKNAMVVRKDGHVGIGTSNPNSVFHASHIGNNGLRQIVGILESSYSNRPTLLFSEDPDSEIIDGMSLEYDGSGAGGENKFYINKRGGDPLITFKNSGDVGIGTVNPEAALHVIGLDNTNTESSLKITSNSHTMFIDGNEIDAMNANMFLQANNSNDLILTQGGGDVGIGTNTPAAKLHVSGLDNDGTDASFKVSNGTSTMLIDGNEIDVNGSGLFLQHNSDENLIMASGGSKVGIGTTVPNEKLEVLGSGSVRLRVTSFNNSSAGIQFVRSSTSNTDWQMYNDGNLKLASSNDIDGGTTEYYSFGTGIFRPAINNALQCGSSGFRWTWIYTVNGVNQSSDRRLKKNIKKLPYGIADILKLQPVTYQWISSADNQEKIGLIAQEVQQVIPEVVDDSNPESLGMNYPELVPILINGIKEQQTMLSALQEANLELEEKTGNLEAAVDDLHNQISELKELLLKQAELSSANN